ncbi:hypothetical protein EV131_12418 [Rhizobium laguerreae]|uniref:Uncharacterized protein n=1 Tax=Rhizobium laguerreae TaxID=1076926 RepID=A0AAX2QB89_9HYPH|nr:hypothetical protein EV131_12418 [Rhizobium laguerreae]
MIDLSGFQFVSSHDDRPAQRRGTAPKPLFVVGQNLQMGGSSCRHESLPRASGLQFALKRPQMSDH